MSEIKLNPVTDYSKYIYSGPSYRVSKIVPISSGQTASLPSTSTTNVQFEIPTAVVNLAKSKLFFDITIPALTLTYPWIYADPLALIDRIQLSTRSGVSLVDIQGVNNFSTMVTPLMTSNSELYQRSVGGLTHAGLTPVTTYGSTTASTDSQQCPVQGIQMYNGLQTQNYRYDDTAGVASSAEVSYSEQRYLFSNVSVSTACCLSYQLNLELLEHSILSLNKELYFNENIILSITFAPTSKFAWTTLTAVPANTPLSIALPLLVSNLSLYLMIETNTNIINGLRDKVLSPEGFNILCPFVYSQKINTGNAPSSSSIFQRFNRGHGRSILRTYWSLFHGTESANTTLDRTNVNLAKVTSYSSTINNMNVQEFPIDCGRSEDWLTP